MLFSLIILSDSGKASDPEISPLISARCAGDTAVHLMAHRWFEPNTCHHLRKRPASWEFSAMRAVFVCPDVCYLVALQAIMLRCPRTYSGRRPGLSRGRCNRWFSTDGHGRAVPAACPVLVRAGGPGSLIQLNEIAVPR
jgi:hypothetical protein